MMSGRRNVISVIVCLFYCWLSGVKSWSCSSAVWQHWRVSAYKPLWQNSSSLMLTFFSTTHSWREDETICQVYTSFPIAVAVNVINKYHIEQLLWRE